MSTHKASRTVCSRCHRWMTSVATVRTPLQQFPLTNTLLCVECVTVKDVEDDNRDKVKNPIEGDIVRGSNIGRKGWNYRWTLCPSCQKGRWLANNRITLQANCPDCGNSKKREKYIGTLSSQWKGGKIVSKYGYIYVISRPTDPYHSMANYLGYIAEHRLVMAKHLGRPLKSSEIVHHLHTKYPAGTIKNKQDNRIENLELLPSKATHDAITALENKISVLTRQVVTLKDKVRLCEWRIRELERNETYKPNKEKGGTD